MASSGVEEILRQVYGTDTFAHMLNGNAVSRAVRGHILLQGALVVRLLTKLTATPVDGPFDMTDMDSQTVNQLIWHIIQQRISYFFVQTCIIYGTSLDAFDFLCAVTLTLTSNFDLQGNNE